MKTLHKNIVSCTSALILTLIGIVPLSTLRAQKQTPGSYRISGTVLNANTGQPLDRADISIAFSKDFTTVQSMQTGPDGHFQFDNLAAAKYALTGSRRGFVTASYDAHDEYSTAIVTGDELVSEKLTLRLVPDAVISGIVTEDSGDPVENARVSLYRKTHDSGIEKIQIISSTNVDDTGAYEFAGLSPGDYFLSAGGRPWYADSNSNMGFAAGSPGPQAAPNVSAQHSPLDLVYATTFYADVVNTDDATPIPLKGGDRIQINFTLHPVPALHLAVRTPIDPSRRNMISTPVLAQQIFGSTEYVETNTRSIAPGQTEISVPPGEYQIHLTGGSGSPSERLTTVDVTSDRAVDAETGVLTTEVSGKLALLSGEAFPQNTIVSLTSAEGQNMNGSVVGKDGSFTLANVPPGKYRLNAFMNGKRLFTAKLAATGAELEGQWIKTGSSAVMIAATVYADPNLEITGFARKEGKPAPGAMIVLVPKDPASDHDLFRRDQSDSDGSFELHDVVPGKYTVVAIEDGWQLNWADPEVIAHYLLHGQYVTVTERNTKAIQMREAVEVQPK